jgi:hypothetical protein
MQVKPFKPLGNRVKTRKLKPSKKQAKDNLIKKLFTINKNESSN